MDRREDDMASLSWPGFVDILSAVIMMFVFFIMVIAVVLSISSVIHKQQVEQESQQKITQEIAEYIEKVKSGKVNIESNETLKKQEETIEQKKKEIEVLNEQKGKIESEINELENTIKQVRARYAETENQNIVRNDDQAELIIFFDQNAISISEETTQEISSFIKDHLPDGSGRRVSITAGDNPGAATLSNSREFSLARMLNVRNNVLQAGVLPEKIEAFYHEPHKRQNSYNWITITIGRGGE